MNYGLYTLSALDATSQDCAIAPLRIPTAYVLPVQSPHEWTSHPAPLDELDFRILEDLLVTGAELRR